MPLRLVANKSSEALCYSVATIGAFAPIYFLLPAGEQRLEKQTTKWAPRWERNISYFTPATEKGIKRIEPPVAKTVQAIDRTLPLERAALNVDRRIKNGITRFEKYQNRKSE